MINFRFHLVSLIAVFLALALGVVMGYAVLGQPTVDTLQGRVDSVEARADQMRGENDRLRDELSRLEQVLGDVDEFAATSRLEGATVVPVVVRGVDSGRVTETVQLARNSGAAVPGVLWLEEKWDITDDDAPAELAGIVGVSPSESRAAIRTAAARALATRLAVGPTSARTDVLVALEDAGFVSFQGIDGIDFDSTRLDGRPARTLLIGGNGAAVRGDRSVVPLAQALVDLGRPVVVADEWRDVDHGPQRGEELGVIRDGELATLVSTVDTFDTPAGPLVAVLVVADRGQGVIGHYGFGSGAERAVPPWSIL